MQLIIDENIMAKAVRIHMFRRKRQRFVSCLLLGLALLLAFYVLGQRGPTPLLMGVMVLLVLLLLMFTPLYGYVLRGFFRRQLRQMAAQGDDVRQVRMEYDGKALRLVTAKADNSTDWSAFTDCHEQDGLLLLYRNTHFFQIVPLDQLTAQDRAAIHRLIEQYGIGRKG